MSRDFSQIPITSNAAPAPIQPKLVVGHPNDRYEQEADRVAEKVMRMPEPQVQRQVEPTDRGGITIQRISAEKEEDMVQTKPAEGVVQRKCAACEEEETLQRTEMEKEEETLQTKAEGGGVPAVTPSIQSGIGQLRQGGGTALPASTRSFMEPRFGHDFSNVKIHAGSQAANLSKSVNARAFTVGQDIFFNRGEFQPNSFGGMQLLAHELTHTLQQSPKIIQRKGENVPGSQAVFDFAQLIINGAFSSSEFAEALAAEDFTTLQLRDLKERVLDLQTTSDPLVDAALEEIDNVLAGRTDLDKVEFVPTPCEAGESASVNAEAWTANERLFGIAEGTEAPVKKGDQGEAVRLVQQALLQWGCEYSEESVNLLPRYRDDGNFGREMKLGVQEFQKRNALSKDGVVGSDTLFKLQEKVVLQSTLEAEAELEQLRAEEAAREHREKEINSLILLLNKIPDNPAYSDDTPELSGFLVAELIKDNYYEAEVITEALSRLSTENEEIYHYVLFEGNLIIGLGELGIRNIYLKKPPKGGDFLEGFRIVYEQLEDSKPLSEPNFGLEDWPKILEGFEDGKDQGIEKGVTETIELVVSLFGSEFWTQMRDALGLAWKIATDGEFRYQLGGVAAEFVYKQLTDLNASTPYHYGRKLGVLFGQLIFEVAVGILTAGAGAAIKAGNVGSLLVKATAKVSKWAEKYPRLVSFARAVSSNALVRGGVQVVAKLTKNLVENIKELTRRISNLAIRIRFALPDLSSSAKAERAVQEVLADEKLQVALRKAEDAVAKAEQLVSKAGDNIDAVSKAADDAAKAEKELAQALDEYMAKTGRGVSEEVFDILAKGREFDVVSKVPKDALKAEFRFVADATPRKVSIKAHGREYDREVALPNTHTYRREKDKGTWCRFSIPKPKPENCDLEVEIEPTAIATRETHVLIYRQYLDDGFTPSGASKAIRPSPSRYPTVEIRPNGDILGDYGDLQPFMREHGLTAQRRTGESSIEVHHLFEDNYAEQFGITRAKGWSVALEADDHAIFSAYMRAIRSKTFYDIDDLFDMHKRMYIDLDHPEWVNEVRKFLKQNSEQIRRRYQLGEIPGADKPNFEERRKRVFDFLDSL